MTAHQNNTVGSLTSLTLFSSEFSNLRAGLVMVPQPTGAISSTGEDKTCGRVHGQVPHSISVTYQHTLMAFRV